MREVSAHSVATTKSSGVLANDKDLVTYEWKTAIAVQQQKTPVLTITLDRCTIYVASPRMCRGSPLEVAAQTLVLASVTLFEYPFEAYAVGKKD